MGIKMVYTSRSRIETFLECPRQGFWNFLYAGKGITPSGISVPLSTGSAIHHGLAVLGAATKSGVESLVELEELATNQALAWYVENVPTNGFQHEEGEDTQGSYQEYVYEEQKALVEALLRTFVRRVWGNWREQYDIIAVEEELALPIKDVTLESRVDALFREKDTGDYYAVSYKTAASLDKRQIAGYNHDLQGLTESYVTEKLKGIKISGVLMAVLLKGRRYERVRGSGKYETLCPLIKGWRKFSNEWDYAHSYEYTDPSNKSGKARLGKGWQPFDVWDEGRGVKWWIDAIFNGEIQPGEDIVEKCFFIPSPYFRNPKEMTSAILQIYGMEREIKEKREKITENVNKGKGDLRKALDLYFPQNKRACDWPSRCGYQEVCYTEEIFNNPLRDGLYQIRIPHHREGK